MLRWNIMRTEAHRWEILSILSFRCFVSSIFVYMASHWELLTYLVMLRMYLVKAFKYDSPRKRITFSHISLMVSAFICLIATWNVWNRNYASNLFKKAQIVKTRGIVLNIAICVHILLAISSSCIPINSTRKTNHWASPSKKSIANHYHLLLFRI